MKTLPDHRFVCMQNNSHLCMHHPIPLKLYPSSHKYPLGSKHYPPITHYFPRKVKLLPGATQYSSIPLAQTSPLLRHHPISNLRPSQTSPYLKHKLIIDITQSSVSPLNL